MGVQSLALIVNKMDLVDWSETAFNDIRSRFEAFAQSIGFDRVTVVPVSALTGDNIVLPALQKAAEDSNRTLQLRAKEAIDAIKHQAKTVTVGISRTEESYEGVLFET